MDVSKFTPPSIVTVPTHQELVDQIISRVQTLDPDYDPVVTDDVHLIADAAAYEMLLVLAELDTVVKGLLVPFATYPELDALVAPVTRLKGEKPTASVTFTLAAARAVDTVIPAGLELTNGKGEQAYLMADVTIPAGELEGNGTIELDAYVATSEIRTETIVTPLPFVAGAAQTEAFGGGEASEDDASLRDRYYAADDVPSTAGSIPGYVYHATSADSRITDVNITSPAAGEVSVVYYAPVMDTAMQTRLEDVLLGEAIKPITDQVTITAAQIVSYDISATLQVYEGYDISQVYTEVLASLETGIVKLRKIGRDVPLSKLTALLHVDGVAEVVLTSPAAGITVSETEVAEHGTITLNTEVYSGD